MSLNNSTNTPFPLVFIKSGLLDLTSSSAQDLFTIEPGKTFIPVSQVNECVSIVNYSDDGSLFIGTNSPDFNNWTDGGGWIAITEGTTYALGEFISNPIDLVIEGTTVTALFNPPLTADSATGYIYILGFYK